MPQKMQTPAEPAKKEVGTPRPSASVILLSPENEVLLLHRVRTSSVFPEAHVFPGGNLSEFHDGSIPTADSADRHTDSLAYQLGAIRETFEESGILIAREKGGDGELSNVSNADRDKARKSIYKNEVRFVEWLESVGGVADTDNLIPFTRWITPLGRMSRFTTQMYIYMLPLSNNSGNNTDPAISTAQSEAHVPTPDGDVEITAARFDTPSTWLEKQRQREIIMFPPQCFLLHLLSQFLTGPPEGSLGSRELVEYYRAQRDKLKDFLSEVPTANEPSAAEHPTARIPWAEKVISPTVLGIRSSDKRSILALDKPGPELKGSDRGGDWERVVLVNFAKGVARDVEVRGRKEVLEEERRLENASREPKL
ncbi:uncharacterized protein F4822DRAFT_434123 [Hypoxylon trugodes]|uniref:uncharacterized protein n=1 Tax=Hypoxylon trugodes TaxID=326681 RepID=UPI00219104CD|nr:uncharacterized protein F4822DRAFT_434123 [Hypoxylon trugodes]KAI1384183.1 hypothetical protein F4822DRAFT_434123 [Hypoxylon trugodes]